MALVRDFFSSFDVYSLLFDLHQYGWFHYIFPFLLIYAIILTILNNVHIFKDNKSVRVIIAVVLSLFAVAFPVTSDGGGYFGERTIGDVMIDLFPGVTAFSMLILGLYIVLAMLGVNPADLIQDKNKKFTPIFYIIAGLGVIFVVYYFGSGMGWWYGFGRDFWLWRLLSDPLLYVFLLFGAIFFIISKDDPPKKDSEKDKHKKEED